MDHKTRGEPIVKDVPTFNQISELIDGSQSIESVKKALCALLTICRKNCSNLDKIRKI